jgi:alpha-1,6-mannosyltransferase
MLTNWLNRSVSAEVTTTPAAAVGARITVSRKAMIRYGGFAGSLALAITAYLGGALSDLPVVATPISILRGDHGVWIVGLWLVGTAALVTAWFVGLRVAATVKWTLVTAFLWMVPFIAAPPYGSRDVYAYACQGALYAAGHNPYQEGVSALPCPWLSSVSVIWRDTPTPYGATWIMLEGFAVKVGGTLTGTIVMFRLLALLGVVVTAWCLPILARALRMPVDRAIWIVLACPLVAMHLIGGAHNDALMVGLIVAGLAVIARRPDRLLPLLGGGALLGVAVSMKITVFAVVPFAAVLAVGGGWHLRELIRRGGAIVVAALAVLIGVSLGSGLGFGWVAALSHAGDSVQWTSPPTAVGLTVSYVSKLFGFDPPAIAIARDLALVVMVAGLVAIWLRFRASGRREGDVLYGAGLALTATVLLAPIVQPWYLTWPLAMCAVVSMRRTRWLMVLTAVACCLILPDGVGLARWTDGPLAPVVTAVAIWAAWCVYRRAWGRRASTVTGSGLESPLRLPSQSRSAPESASASGRVPAEDQVAATVSGRVPAEDQATG